MRKIKLAPLVLLLCFFVKVAAAQETKFTRQQYDEDFDYLWRSISDEYAYFDQKQTDWKKVREIYRPQINGVKTRTDFVALLESVLEELYDFRKLGCLIQVRGQPLDCRGRASVSSVSQG